MLDLEGKLSVIMPAYNEGKLIYNSIVTTINTLSSFVRQFEIIVVNDGSFDNTRAEIERAIKKDSRVKLLTSRINRGKGNAILSGVSQAEGEYIAFLDADLELHPRQLESYLNRMLDDSLDVVIGCKFHRDSKLNYPLKRKIISLGYYIMLMVMFHLNVKDTQTGIKVFKAAAIKPVAHLIRTQGFAYDIELLVALNRRGCSIGQMPVEVDYVRETGTRRVGAKDIVGVFKDTFAIYHRVYFKHYYDVKEK